MSPCLLKGAHTKRKGKFHFTHLRKTNFSDTGIFVLTPVCSVKRWQGDGTDIPVKTSHADAGCCNVRRPPPPTPPLSLLISLLPLRTIRIASLSRSRPFA